MPVSASKVLMISIFLIGGMLLAGVIMQPEASFLAWDVQPSDFPANSSQQERHYFLLKYAVLAASSHNSQPWMFNVSDDEILLYADRSRWLSVADAEAPALDALGEAMQALKALGYSPQEAASALKGVKGQAQTADEMIRLALRNMAQQL